MHYFQYSTLCENLALIRVLLEITPTIQLPLIDEGSSIFRQKG